MPMTQTRRRFLTSLSLAGVAGLLRPPRAFAAEGVLETTSVWLPKILGVCVSPRYAAEDLLHAEGFTDVRYVEREAAGIAGAIGRGKLDFGLQYSPLVIPAIDAGESLTVLAGIHVGCFELFVKEEGIRNVADLKGKSVGVQDWGSTAHVLVALMAAHVGLDPAKDIRWVADPKVKPIEQFIEGKIDAVLGFPPQPQDLRARHIGHVIVNSTVDRPWSQYFCCMLAGNREYVQNCPVATKRVVRAILKATDLCATEPMRVARQIVDGGFTPRYDYAAQSLSELPYDKWREYDAEDTVRFYALRMHEVGFIKSSPQKIIADGTDWRFLNELKRELKA
jgi:NitT/TauT family transport system substrate-binding protein